MKTIYAENRSIIPLGREGENNARQIVFDLTEFINLYGPGTAQLLYQRPKDERPYIREIEQDDSTATWILGLWDTDDSSQRGRCELRWYVGEVLAKSKTWQTEVDLALDTPTDETPSDPETGWVDSVLQAGSDAQSAARRAEAAAQRAENAAGGGSSGGGGESGGGGMSYTIGLGLKITDGNTLEVDSATDFSGDNDRPASAALVKAQLGNIEAFLATI